MTVQHEQTRDKFWSKVEKTDCCWIYNGQFNKKRKRGVFRTGAGVRIGAHLFAWEDDRPPLPPRTRLDRLCDSPRCVRPSHHVRASAEDKVATKVTAKVATTPAVQLEAQPRLVKGSSPSPPELAAMLAAIGRLTKATEDTGESFALLARAVRLLDTRLKGVEERLGEQILASSAAEPLARLVDSLDHPPWLAALGEQIDDAIQRRAPADPPSGPRLLVAARTEPEQPPPPEPALDQLLMQAFVRSLPDTPNSARGDAEQLGLLLKAFDLALGAADCDTAQASQIFERWLRLYAGRRPTLPTPRRFLTALGDGLRHTVRPVEA